MTRQRSAEAERTAPDPWRLRAITARAAAIFLAACLFAPSALAHDYKHGDIRIGHLWSPPSQDGRTAVYGPFLNRGAESDRLIGASTEVAGSARFCAGEKAGNGCQSSIPIEPNKPYALAPWRSVIQLTGLKRPLETGDSFSLTLTFERAGEITVDIVVETSAGH